MERHARSSMLVASRLSLAHLGCLSGEALRSVVERHNKRRHVQSTYPLPPWPSKRAAFQQWGCHMPTNENRGIFLPLLWRVLGKGIRELQ